MPIYEYRCGDCGTTFEEIQRFSDPDPESCPECDGEDVSRLVSRTNFQLKGGGWYADDYESPSTTADNDDTTSGESSETETDSDSSATDSSSNEEAAAE